MIKPDVPAFPDDAMLEETVEDALENGVDIEHKRFYGEEMPFVHGRMVEFNGCIFEKCTFGENEIERIVFVDCIFKKCDLSRFNLQKSTLQRVQFSECRMLH